MKIQGKAILRITQNWLLVLYVAWFCAYLLGGCTVCQHEEVEVIHCPVIDADTIDVPGWDMHE